MPQRTDVHIDAALSQLSVAFKNDDFIGEQLAPSLSVSKNSDKYFIYGKENFNLDNDLRAPGTRAKRVDWSVSTDSYLLEEHALEGFIDDDTRDDADEPLSLESDETEFLTDRIALRTENSVATLLTTTSSYASGHSSTATAYGGQWSNPATDVIAVVSAAKALVHSKVAKRINTIGMGFQVWEKLKQHPLIIERIKYSQLGVVTEDLVASLFGVDKILVGGALKNTAKEGATPTLEYVWGKNIVLAYVEPGGGRKSINLARVFRKTGFRQTEKWDDRKVKGMFVRVTDKFDEKITVNTAGVLLTAAIP